MMFSKKHIKKAKDVSVGDIVIDSCKKYIRYDDTYKTITEIKQIEGPLIVFFYNTKNSAYSEGHCFVVPKDDDLEITSLLSNSLCKL